MTKTKVVFISPILFSCFSKAKSQEVNIDAINKILIGTWNWFKSSHDFDSTGPIPDDTLGSCNCKSRIVFSNNYQVEEYFNDTLISTESYSIEVVHDIKRDLAILRSKYISGEIRSTNDTLGIGWFGGCASLKFYIKSKN